jgi:hypothetical protein
MTDESICAARLTIAQGSVYTGFSRWEGDSSRRASCPPAAGKFAQSGRLPTADKLFHASLLRTAVWNLRNEIYLEREFAGCLRRPLGNL